MTEDVHVAHGAGGDYYEFEVPEGAASVKFEVLWDEVPEPPEGFDENFRKWRGRAGAREPEPEGGLVDPEAPEETDPEGVGRWEFYYPSALGDSTYLFLSPGRYALNVTYIGHVTPLEIPIRMTITYTRPHSGGTAN